MKSLIRCLAFSALAIPGFLLADDFGDDPFGGDGQFVNGAAPKQIRIVVDFIEVKAEFATKMLAKQRTGSNDADLYRAALEAIEKEENGRILDSAMIVTRSGQRAKVESGEEVIYPTEFIQAEAVDTEEDKNKKEKEKEEPKPKRGIIPPLPTAFDMRPVGLTLEVDPVVDADNITIELNIAPELVYENEDNVFAIWETDEATTFVEQPTFFVMKFSTAVTLTDGQPLLATVHTPRDKDGKRDGTKKVLAFVRADILRHDRILEDDKEVANGL